MSHTSTRITVVTTQQMDIFDLTGYYNISLTAPEYPQCPRQHQPNRTWNWHGPYKSTSKLRTADSSGNTVWRLNSDYVLRKGLVKTNSKLPHMFGCWTIVKICVNPATRI